MEKPDTDKRSEFLEHVLKLNGDIELSKAFQVSLESINGMDIAQLNRIGLKTYEEGKWSVHKILQHLIDWDRLWCYQAVIFAGGEGLIRTGHAREVVVG